MRALLKELKWQFILLQKNQIISISIAVTVFYGLVLYFLRNAGNMDKVLTAIVLNDPATIGFFFIGLTISIESKQKIIEALFITPLSHHTYLLSRVLSLSIIGCICSICLVAIVMGVNFNWVPFILGTFSICLLSALLGIIIISYAVDFLTFIMYSIILFLGFINLPLLNYLNVYDIGFLKYIFPVQPGIDLLVSSYSNNAPTTPIWAYALMILWLMAFYQLAYKTFQSKLSKNLI